MGRKKKKMALPGGHARRVFRGFLVEDLYQRWNDWGEVITKLRESLRMDQEEFGRFLGGVSRQRISSYERMQAEPPIQFWANLARRFALNLSWAFTGKGVPWVEGMEGVEEYERFETAFAEQEAAKRAEEAARDKLFATPMDERDLKILLQDWQEEDGGEEPKAARSSKKRRKRRG